MTAHSFTALELGRTLLDSAIECYVRGEFVAALVLAGAAEDHLGGAHAAPPDQWRDDPRAHKQDARDFNLVYEHLFGEPHAKPWDAVNEVKNRTKHFNREPLVMDPEDEAYWALDRATKNFALAHGTYHPRTGEVDALHKVRLDAHQSLDGSHAG